MLAGVSGGSGTSSAKEPSAVTSALGAGMSGAATGAMVAGPWGAAAGAAIGIGMSLLG